MNANRLKKVAPGVPAIKQGIVAGHPISWNPDDARFYVHATGVMDGTEVLGTFVELRNANQFARKLAKEGR